MCNAHTICAFTHTHFLLSVANMHSHARSQSLHLQGSHLMLERRGCQVRVSNLRCRSCVSSSFPASSFQLRLGRIQQQAAQGENQRFCHRVYFGLCMVEWKEFYHLISIYSPDGPTDETSWGIFLRCLLGVRVVDVKIHLLCTSVSFKET